MARVEGLGLRAGPCLEPVDNTSTGTSTNTNTPRVSLLKLQRQARVRGLQFAIKPKHDLRFDCAIKFAGRNSGT